MRVVCTEQHRATPARPAGEERNAQSAGEAGLFVQMICSAFELHGGVGDEEVPKAGRIWRTRGRASAFRPGQDQLTVIEMPGDIDAAGFD